MTRREGVFPSDSRKPSEPSAFSLSPETVRAFEAMQQRTDCPPGFRLFSEGEPCAGIFLISKGEARLSIFANEKKRLTLRLAGPGEVLGLGATVSGRPYEATAETVVPSQVGFVWREHFLRFLHDHAEAALWVAQLLSEEVGTTLEQVRSLQRVRSGKSEK